MKQTIEIEVPEGKKAVWKDNNTIVFEDITLPKTWEEYCEANPFYNEEYFIGTNAGIVPHKSNFRRNPDFDKNLLATKEDAKAHLALMQLHRLRDYYRQGWVPKNGEDTYAIQRYKDGTYLIANYYIYSSFLSFQSKEVAKEFLSNFRDLIEQAKDLI